MANKKTVVEMYKEILPLCVNDEQRAFINKRIEITEKKNANRGEAKPTKTQLENEGIKTVILSVMSTKPVTIGELMKTNAELADYSSQKIAALLTQLLKANALVRSEVRGKAYFALPTKVEAE